MAPTDGTSARKLGMASSAEVVEIGLLLPSSWADALLEMSQRKRQSIGQLLRNMIDRGLVDDRRDHGASLCSGRTGPSV